MSILWIAGFFFAWLVIEGIARYNSDADQEWS